MSEKWQTITLGEIGKVSMCKRILKHQTEDKGDIPFFKISTFGEKADVFISKDIYEGYRKKYSFPKQGDVLISAAGTVGRTVVYDGKPAYFQDSNIIWIDNDELKVLNKFLYYFYQTKPWQVTKGSTIPRLYNDNLRRLKINLPNIETQQKIASILSALDDKIELNNKINDNLEQQAKTLYDYWFVQNADESWEVKTIGDYCLSTGGFAFKSSWWTDNGTPVIKIKDIQENNTLNLNDLSFIDLSDKKLDVKFQAEAGNVVIAMTGATVGKYAIVPFTDEKIYVNQRVGYFNLGKDPFERLPFLINSLHQSYFRDAVFSLAKGAAQPNISNEQINSIRLVFPNDELITLFNKKMKAVYQKILTNQQQNQQLSQLRDWLLPMLMNGQVKVD